MRCGCARPRCGRARVARYPAAGPASAAVSFGGARFFGLVTGDGLWWWVVGCGARIVKNGVPCFEHATTANDREKYATYTRDSLTGLDCDEPVLLHKAL